MTSEKLELIDTVYKTHLDSEYKNIGLENSYPYLFSKSYNFFTNGVVNFRENDFFHQPPLYLKSSDYVILFKGCQQILEGKGLSKEYPLTGLGVNGFYNLFRLFHYEPKKCKSLFGYVCYGKKGILDICSLEHRIDKNEIVYYNFIS